MIGVYILYWCPGALGSASQSLFCWSPRNILYFYGANGPGREGSLTVSELMIQNLRPVDSA